jgi:hypothetical protein
MDPDLDLQLKVAMKALGDTIGPAIDPANKPALEQFGLVMATLGMVREHLPVQRRFVRRQLEDAIRLAGPLDAAAGEGALASAIAAGKAVLADPEAEADAIEAHRGALNGQASAVIAGLDAAGLESVRAIVLDHARPGLERTRAWFAGAGFEAGATDVRPLDALL